MSKSSKKCRHCHALLGRKIIDLGSTPLANSYLSPDELEKPEPSFPLCIRICPQCHLLQLEKTIRPETLFSDYAYFSSFSSSWLEHTRLFSEAVTDRFSFGQKSQIVEIASNDGHLLQNFKKLSIPVLGVEPAANIAKAAVAMGIPTEVQFFGKETAQNLLNRGFAADLLIANNVLAHVPDINDFVAGLALLLKPNGVLTVEFPHSLNMLQEAQFDTIYHEHVFYLSFHVIGEIFTKYGLTIFDVEQHPTHGGSLRVFAQRSGQHLWPTEERVTKLLKTEEMIGINTADSFLEFENTALRVRRELLDFLNSAKMDGKRVAAYGAAAKGNTLLNFCGINSRLLEYVVDKNPHKQGLLLPGSHLQIFSPEKISETKPDYVLLLPWNLKAEIIDQMKHIRSWQGRFVTAIPKLEIYD